MKPSSANPKLYREMSIPFLSHQAASEAVTAFHEELGELRRKHKIPDLYVVAEVGYLDGDEEYASRGAMHYGSMEKRESMAAWAAGFEAAESRRRIEDTVVAASKFSRSDA